MIDKIRNGPICFVSDMVLAVMRDVSPKTQTRRVLLLNNKKVTTGVFIGFETGHTISANRHKNDANTLWAGFRQNPDSSPVYTRSPYGNVADRLWVQESFRTLANDGEYATVEYKCDGAVRGGLWIPTNHRDKPTSQARTKWISGRFMPKWASRTPLEITDVRCDLRQNISEADILAEGMVCFDRGLQKGTGLKQVKLYSVNPKADLKTHGLVGSEVYDSPFRAFSYLWDSINLKRGYPWADNGYDWAYTFKRL